MLRNHQGTTSSTSSRGAARSQDAAVRSPPRRVPLKQTARFASFDTNPQQLNNSLGIVKMIRQSRTSGKLNLSNQNLKAIPDELFTRADIQPSGNGVSLDRGDSDFNWWEEVDLSKLIIADNQITGFDPRINELGALTYIDAHNNKLSAIPDMQGLQNLTILQLSSNNISSLPESLFELKLAELHLSSNQFTVLPESIGQLKSLIVLDLSGNRLSTLPSTTSTLKNLASLNLASNTLQSLPSLANMTSLTHLNVSHNKLTTIGDLSGCLKLQDINASENAIGTIFTGGNMSLNFPALVRLDLRVNRISTLTCSVAIQTPVLKDLLLSSNLLASISGSGIIESSKALDTLDIKDNNFSHIPVEVLDLPLLKKLFVDGNPIRVPRRAIIEKGTAAILQYMRERQPAP
ncbi:Leucine-rich repeat-containing protein 40 [Chytridiales sp. JEL 0842]|nr:Leucine-rich repeat-containing protein 40 [Chytridiales sp. JEL 0842]